MALITINRTITVSCAEHGPAEGRSRTGIRQWRGRTAMVAGFVAVAGLGTGVAMAGDKPAPHASTTNVSFISLATPHKLFTDKKLAAHQAFSTAVLGGAATVPTNATTVRLSVKAGGKDAGTMTFYPTGDPAGGSGQSLSWPKGGTSTVTIEENIGLADEVTFNNGSKAATASATITGYSTQVTDADVAPADGSGGQVLTNTGTGAAWRTLPLGTASSFSGAGGTSGQVLTNTGSGAKWETVNTTSSPWELASTATTQTIDGTLLQTETISAPAITATALADASISVYMTYPGSNYIPLPYTSFAGGAVNTVSYQLVVGKIILTRFTDDNSASIGFGSANEFRYVITTATGLGVGVHARPAGPRRASAGSASN